MSSLNGMDNLQYTPNVNANPNLAYSSSLTRVGNSIISSTPRTSLSTGATHNTKYAYTEHSHIDTSHDNFEKPLKGLIEELRTLSTDEYKLRKNALEQKNWRSTLNFIFEKNQLDANGNVISKFTPLTHQYRQGKEKEGKSVARVTNNKKYIPLFIDKLPNIDRIHDWSLTEWKRFGEIQQKCKEHGYDLVKYMYRLPQENLMISNDANSNANNDNSNSNLNSGNSNNSNTNNNNNNNTNNNNTNNNKNNNSTPTNGSNSGNSLPSNNNNANNLYNSNSMANLLNGTTNDANNNSLGVVIDSSGVGLNLLQTNFSSDPRVLANLCMSETNSNASGQPNPANVQSWLWKPNVMKHMKYLYVNRLTYTVLSKQLQQYLLTGRDTRTNNVIVEQHSREDLLQAEKSMLLGLDDGYDSYNNKTSSGSNQTSTQHGNKPPAFKSISSISGRDVGSSRTNSIHSTFRQQQQNNLSYLNDLDNETRQIKNWHMKWNQKLDSYRKSLGNNGNNTLETGTFKPSGYIAKNTNNNSSHESGSSFMNSPDRSGSGTNMNLNKNDNSSTGPHGSNNITDLDPLLYSLYGNGSSLALSSACDSIAGKQHPTNANVSSNEGPNTRSRAQNNRRANQGTRTTFGLTVPPSVLATLNSQNHNMTNNGVSKAGINAVISEVQNDYNKTNIFQNDFDFNDYNVALKHASLKLQSISGHLSNLDTPILDNVPYIHGFSTPDKFINRLTNTNNNMLVNSNDNDNVSATTAALLLGDLYTRCFTVNRTVGQYFNNRNGNTNNTSQRNGNVSSSSNDGMSHDDLDNDNGDSTNNTGNNNRCTDLSDLSVEEKKCLKRMFSIILRDQTRMPRAVFRSRLLQAGLDPNLPFIADKLFRCICSSTIPYIDFRDYSYVANLTLHSNSFYRAMFVYHLFDLDEDGILTVKDLFTGLLLGLHKQFPNDFSMLSLFLRSKLAATRSVLRGSAVVASECSKLHLTVISDNISDRVNRTSKLQGTSTTPTSRQRQESNTMQFDEVLAEFGVDMPQESQKEDDSSKTPRFLDNLSPNLLHTGMINLPFIHTELPDVQTTESKLHSDMTSSSSPNGAKLLRNGPAMAAALTSYWMPSGPVMLCGKGVTIGDQDIIDDSTLIKTNLKVIEQGHVDLDGSVLTTTDLNTLFNNELDASFEEEDEEDMTEDAKLKKARKLKMRKILPQSIDLNTTTSALKSPLTHGSNPNQTEYIDKLNSNSQYNHMLNLFRNKNDQITKIPSIKQWIHMIQRCNLNSQLVYITPMEMVEMFERYDNSDVIRLLQIVLIHPDLRNIQMSKSIITSPGKVLYPWDKKFLEN